MAKVIKENGFLVLRDDWDEDDIRSVAEQMEIELTDGMVEEVMHWVAKAFDATIGINWDSIEAAIELTVRLERQRK
jgi:sulfur relay (sulfurtransferase) DsrC/TusE family protein